jgi:hypothetical protein
MLKKSASGKARGREKGLVFPVYSVCLVHLLEQD